MNSLGSHIIQPVLRSDRASVRLAGVALTCSDGPSAFGPTTKSGTGKSEACLSPIMETASY